MPSISIAERLLTGGSSATMALPDWQSGENAKNYTKFFATTQQRLTSNELKQRHPFTIGNRFYLRRMPISHQHTIVKGHPKPYECFQHRYSPTKHQGCNAPIQWNWILWLESPSQADSHGLYRPKPTEADRSTKNIGFPMHFVHLTPNSQRYLGNKIN